MENFSLIASLITDAEKKVPVKKSPIRYEQYAVTLHNKKERIVFIPTRVSNDFENELNETVLVTDRTVKNLLRKFNGVTEIK